MTPFQVIIAALLTVAVMIFVFHVFSESRFGGFAPAMVVLIGAIRLFVSLDKNW